MTLESVCTFSMPTTCYMQPLLAGSKCQCTWMTKKGEVLLITSNLSVAMKQSRMTSTVICIKLEVRTAVD
ncbi:hypothetical protein [Wolbachia endosymbiont of Folsomia candida]|uniref:hypothetical protein n=1 Tax=Wolbachia endosymbiont of Folsomia candida TaxID=169402 RepID=UPI0013006510|nr:hypothetical protein [Wolbachia endosymbiont of Folsomia candida]